MSASKRACTGTTKKGTACKAWPLKGRDTCLAHADAETRASVGFTAEAGKLGGRPPNPRAVDVLRERIEQDIERVIGPLFDGLTAERGHFVLGEGDDAKVVAVTDHVTRIAAVRELLDRAYGKPTQATEISGPEGAPIKLEAPADHADRATRAARLLQEAGLLQGPSGPPSVNGSNGHNGNGHASNGNGNGHH